MNQRDPNKAPHLTIKSRADIDYYRDWLQQSATRALQSLCGEVSNPMRLLLQLKFEQAGWHPVEDRSLNFIEQINQTCTYAVALAATAVLLERHREAGGFKVAPGAHMSLPLDIMSEHDDVVGAETFAAVHPRNNRKLARDLAKLAAHPDIQHRYVFFASPRFPGGHQTQFDRDGIEVWSVDI